MNRGLFFQDGENWKSMRNKMNPLFFKNLGTENTPEYSKSITDELIQDLVHQVEANAEWYFLRY